LGCLFLYFFAGLPFLILLYQCKTLNINIMKNLLKIGVLAAAVMFSISSCSSCGNKGKSVTEEKVDSPKTTIDTTQKAIDTAKKAEVETAKKESVKK